MHPVQLMQVGHAFLPPSRIYQFVVAHRLLSNPAFSCIWWFTWVWMSDESPSTLVLSSSISSCIYTLVISCILNSVDSSQPGGHIQMYTYIPLCSLRVIYPRQLNSSSPQSTRYLSKWAKVCICNICSFNNDIVVILCTSNSCVGASTDHQNHNNMKGNVFLVTSLVYVCSVFCCSCCCYYKISGGMNLSRAESVSCEDLCIIKILYSNNDWHVYITGGFCLMRGSLHSVKNKWWNETVLC